MTNYTEEIKSGRMTPGQAKEQDNRERLDYWILQAYNLKKENAELMEIVREAATPLGEALQANLMIKAQRLLLKIGKD